MTNQLDVRPEAVHLSNPAELFSFFDGYLDYTLDFMQQAEDAEVRWVSEKWTSRNNLGDNYVLGGVHYETSASTVHCRVQKERC